MEEGGQNLDNLISGPPEDTPIHAAAKSEWQRHDRRLQDTEKRGPRRRRNGQE